MLNFSHHEIYNSEVDLLPIFDGLLQVSLIMFANIIVLKRIFCCQVLGLRMNILVDLCMSIDSFEVFYSVTYGMLFVPIDQL